MDSSYLTFDANNLPSYDGPENTFSVFGFSAYNMQIPVFLDNHNFYGYLLDSEKNSLGEHKRLVSLNLLLDYNICLALLFAQSIIRV